MFTPQRKSWALSPRASADASNPRTAGGSFFGKGKGVAGASEAAQTPPPPRASLGASGGEERGGGGDKAEVWRRFREAGLLDEASLQRTDREALATRILELENELHDYQYNMGLLLIEKKEWSSRYEEIRLRLSEAEEILKREQTARVIATSEAEKREENLRRALGVEKQCVADLEKALRDIRSEIAQVKFTSDKKMTEAHALEASIEEKCLEVERKLHSADAKLAEASRKSSEADRKLEDAEARERRVQRETSSLNAERKALEKDIAEQRDHLREWEKKLQDGQKRLVDGQRFLNEREGKANEADRALKEKEKELEEARKLIEVTTNSLKDKEDNIDVRLKDLVCKEKDADAKLKALKKKEKELLQIEEKLDAREREEMQKLLDKHNAVLNAKEKEFEMEMDSKRKSFEEEIKSKVDELEKQKKEFNRKEERLSKREQELEYNLEKLKIMEKDHNTKSKALKKWEESVKSDEERLRAEKEKLIKDSEELKVHKNELEALRAAMKAEEQRIVHEKESLKLTKEEREQHLQLQSKLKQEIEEYRMLKESVIKESDALREEREKFEKEWDALDEKRQTLDAELKKITEERQKFEKWRHNEQERLKNEELQGKAEIEKQLEDIKLKKEAFENTMEHERLVAREDVERQLADIAREHQLHKHDLEMSMQKKQEEMEKILQEKEREFEMKRDTEVSHITSLISSNDLKIRTLKVEQDRLDREKAEFFRYKKKFEADQIEVHKDIDTLRLLSKHLKDQRAEFLREKERFIAAAEQCKTCHGCGAQISDLGVLCLKSSTAEIENAGAILQNIGDGYIAEHSESKQTTPSSQGIGFRSYGSGIILRCSRIFKLSPAKICEPSSEGRTEQAIQSGEQLDMVASNLPNQRVADNSFEAQMTGLGDVPRNEDLPRLDKAGNEIEPSLGVGDNSVDIVRVSDDGVRPTEQNEMEGSSRPAENDPQPHAPNQQRRQPIKRGKAKTVKRTRSVKAVVEDAKAFIGESSDLNVDGEPNGNAKDSQHIDEESQGTSVHTDQLASNSRQKRQRPQTSEMTTSELEAEDGEAQSHSVSIGGRRKRRATAGTGMQAPGERRYNLRRSTIANSVAASQAASDQPKEHKAASHQPSPDNETLDGDHVGVETSKHGGAVSPTSGLVERTDRVTNRVQKSTARSVTEVSSQEMVEVYVENDVIKSVEISERTGEDGDEVDGAAGTSEPATPSGGGSSATEVAEDLDDEEDVEKHNASIGKKLWNFFTT